LAKNGTDIQVDLAWVGDSQALSHILFLVIEALIFESECHLKVVECIAQLVCLAAQACKVVVSDGFDARVALGEELSLFEEVLAKSEIFALQVCHAQNVTYDCDLCVHHFQLFGAFTSLLFDHLLGFVESLERLDLVASVFEGQALLK
jgi:hypothetical protein